MGSYATQKQVGTAHPTKVDREKFVSVEQLDAVLAQIEKSGNLKWKRDHAAIYLGFYLALRVYEAACMHRNWFKDIEHDVIYVARLKRAQRIPWTCPQCHKTVRVSAEKIGQIHRCGRCDGEAPVTASREISSAAPLIPLPVIERKVSDYIRAYLGTMRPDQEWLLESHPGQHVSDRMLRYIWQTYSIPAGISRKVSYHALRHGRGAQVWDLFQDQQMVKEMLGHSSLDASKFYIHLSPGTLLKRREILEGAAVGRGVAQIGSALGS